MTKHKSTKRALLLSALSLLLCVSMLVGSTFAWFTDSVTSAGNIIQSGTLDVDLVDEQNNSMAGQVIEFVAADGRAQNEILWEPGCKYNTEPVYVVNNGSLALKYRIAISGIDGNAKLLEAIEWTVTIDGQPTDLAAFEGQLFPGQTGKSGAIVLTGHMKEEAGNEYQGLTAEGISIMVTATQLTAESDSFNNQYDEAAKYAAQTMLTDVAAVAAGETATVKLESDGYVVLTNETPVGAKVAGNVTLDMNGKTLVVDVADGNAHKALFNIVKGGKLTVTGNGAILLTAGANNLVTAIFNNTAGELVIENGTYKMDNASDWQVALIPTIIDNNSNASAATTTINGGDFYHTRNMFRNFSGNGVASLTINGGTFNGEADDWAAIWNQKPSANVPEGNGLITINGGEFNYVEISNEFQTGVTVDTNKVAMPTTVGNSTELAAAVKDGYKKIYLTKGVYSLPTLADKEGVSIIAEEGTVVGGDKVSNGFGGNFGKNTTIKNVTFQGTSTGARWTYAQGGTITFENCAFLGNDRGAFHMDASLGATLVFKNCVLSGFNAFASDLTKVYLENCTMTNNGKYNGLNMYCDFEITDCVFEFTGTGSEFIDYEKPGKTLTISGCTAYKNGVEIDIATMIGGSQISNTNITIDGVTVTK